MKDEQSEDLSPSRGRKHFDFYEQSEVKSLVICDRIPMV